MEYKTFKKSGNLAELLPLINPKDWTCIQCSMKYFGKESVLEHLELGYSGKGFPSVKIETSTETIIDTSLLSSYLHGGKFPTISFNTGNCETPILKNVLGLVSEMINEEYALEYFNLFSGWWFGKEYSNTVCHDSEILTSHNKVRICYDDSEKEKARVQPFIDYLKKIQEAEK